MVEKVIVRNNATKAEFTIPVDVWNANRQNGYWKRVFSFVANVNTPPEVLALQKKIDEKNGLKTPQKRSKKKSK